MVEDVLVLVAQRISVFILRGLNPCCGGRCSSTFVMNIFSNLRVCLNPCCGGRCSSTPRLYNKQHSTNSLNPCCGGRCSSTVKNLF